MGHRARCPKAQEITRIQQEMDATKRRDIGLMDTPVEQACKTEEMSVEDELMDISEADLIA